MLGRLPLRSLMRFVLLVTGLALSGCEKEKTTVSVDVHGVNYRGDEFSYLLIDPNNPDDSNAGEHIDSFAAGGTTCCYPLPKQWQPGIKVKMRITHWLPKDPGGHVPEVKEVQTAEVPPYVDGKPGELWVLRGEEGTVSVVSSDYQPDHPKWPGKLKGWPVPSLEYRRHRWELLRDHQQSFVDLYMSLLDELKKAPQKRATDAWRFAEQYDRPSTVGFKGPEDPSYIANLKKRYQSELQNCRLRLRAIEEERP